MNKENLTMAVSYIKDCLPHLDREKRYTLEDLCSKFWPEFTHGQRRQLGYFISQMVKQNKLPFREGKNGNTKTYYLI